MKINDFLFQKKHLFNLFVYQPLGHSRLYFLIISLPLHCYEWLTLWSVWFLFIFVDSLCQTNLKRLFYCWRVDKSKTKKVYYFSIQKKEMSNYGSPFRNTDSGIKIRDSENEKRVKLAFENFWKSKEDGRIMHNFKTYCDHISFFSVPSCIFLCYLCFLR